MKKHLFSLVPGLFSLLLFTASAQAACTHYASPTGGGTGGSQGSPFRVADFWAVAGPGATLCLVDGTYAGSSSMITPPGSLSGTADSPITVRALNDGGVLLDGQYTMTPISIFSPWWVVEGVNAAHSGDAQTVVQVGTGGDHTIIRRVIAWDCCGTTKSGNNHVVQIFNNANVLFEDMAAWGVGRKTFARIGETNGTFRRVFGMKTYEPEAGGMVITHTYKSINPLTENCIATADYDPSSPSFDGALLDHDHYCDYQSGGCGASAGIGPAVTVTAKGNIAYFTDAQYLPGLSYMNNPGLDSNSVAHDLTVTTVADDLVALRRTGPATVQARVQYGRPVGGPLYSIRANYTDDGTSFPRYGKAVYTVGHYTDSLGTLAGGTHTTEAGTKSLGQFLGGDLLQLAAPTRPPFGAWLRYRYVGGQLTTQELWPWPMNDRIKAAMVQSGYAAKGGLDGAGETDLTKLIFALAGASTAPVRPLLLAAWPFDGDSGTTVTDTTGNGHTGTLLAGASLGPGRLGAKAVYFDGITSGVQMAGLLGQPAAVSLDTWFKVDTAATPAKLISIGDYLSLFVTTTQIYSLYWDGARQQQTAWNVNYVGAGWHHAVAVIDPPHAMQNLYVDGVLRATTTLSNPIVYSSGGAPDTFLGRHSANNKYNFVGAMDEVQISNYALTEAEATARYQRGVSASWPFDGDTGTTATDTTGNGHTGTLLTGASFGAGFIGAQALLFDGTTSGMQVSGVFGQLPTLSVDLWVRVDSVDSTTQTAKLISIGDYINIVVTPTQLMSTYWDGSRQQQTPYGAPYIGTGWHHVVAVVDPPHAVQKLYVDGTLRAQTTLTNPIIYTGGAPDTFLGRHGLNNKYNFVGAVDEVQISNYALTQAEVTARYQRGH